MLDQSGIAKIGEAAGELFEEAKLVFDFAKQQATGIAGDFAAVERGDGFARTEVLEFEKSWNTLCHCPAAPLLRCKLFG